MPDNAAPKTSVELAMERLRKKDADEGVITQPMTDEQKRALAEVRSLYDSKLAEQDILQQSATRRLQLGAEPAALDEVARQFRRERERLTSERDARLDKIRRGEAGE